eukprot:CAMPEP_0175517464 /NCGR_PEP_ID=MMETSP0096-20121207/14974_1 /TAXON_ID=311494 /ORGANISM="Alexandrium monilatum, Strain CCMP3105" /LENGTH=152 /DNA_ID=CAMNT_0016819785 /DNA_START=15 /DNA_END=469 /DNA_ORIENTATION=+
MQPVSAVEFYGARICAVYERHNPQKLAEVPALLEKYAGCEAEMYDRICEKYGVEPEALPEHLAADPPCSPEPRPPLGYARKASAPAPPPQLRGGAKGAPSASSLMARFQSLVSCGGGHDEAAEQGAEDGTGAGSSAPCPRPVQHGPGRGRVA